LRLNNNKITSIELNAFINLKALEGLDLSNNSIEGKVKKEFFLNFNNLRVLYLNNNKITKLDDSLLNKSTELVVFKCSNN